MTSISERRRQFANNYIAREIKVGMSRSQQKKVYKRAWREAKKRYP